MDSGVQEESFSSQNDNPTVSSIRESLVGYRYLLSDGTSFFVHISKKASINLFLMDEVSDDILAVLVGMDQFSSALIQAMTYLNLRDHSRKELALKLRKKKYSVKTVDEVCCSLMERGFLNDENYADIYINSRVSRGRYSYSELMVQLQSKGISRSIISSVLEEYYTDEENIRALNYNIEKLMRKKNISKEKITASLQRKGFRYSDISEILDDFKTE